MIVFCLASFVLKTKSIMAIAFDYRFARETKACIFCQIQTLKIQPLKFKQIRRCFRGNQVYSHLQGDLAQYSLSKYRKINLLFKDISLLQTIQVLGDRFKKLKITLKTLVSPALPLQQLGGGE